jgi:hypothetical protein
MKTDFPQFLSCSSVKSVTDAGTGTWSPHFLSDLVPGATDEEGLLPRSILSHLFTKASH